MLAAETFFQTHAVFTLSQFRELVGGKATPATTQTRIKYHLSRGCLKLLEKGVYAVVPPSVAPKTFVPDRFLVAVTLREDAVLAYHSAVELLGYAHSTCRDTFYLTARRRKDLRLGGDRVRALLHPKPLRNKGQEGCGVDTTERLGVRLKMTVQQLAAGRGTGYRREPTSTQAESSSWGIGTASGLRTGSRLI